MRRLQLIEATTGGHLWAERYDRPFADIFALQDEIRQKIVLALKVQLTPEEQARFQRAPTTSLEAYDFYLRGLEFQSRAWTEGKEEANRQARQMFEHAVELDPPYAAAYALLGWTYFLDFFFQWRPAPVQSLKRASEVAQQAVSLDDSLSIPHRILGVVYVWQKQHEQAIAEAERAIALDPNAAEGYVALGQILVFAGRPEEGIRLIEKAIRLNPRYPPMYLMNLGFAYRVAGRYEKALTVLKSILPLIPNNGPTHVNLAICYAELGRLEEARAEVVEVRRLYPNWSLEGMKNLPYKDPAAVERLVVALRKAGFK